MSVISVGHCFRAHLDKFNSLAQCMSDSCMCCKRLYWETASVSQVCRVEKSEHKGRRDGRTNLLEQGLMSDLESDFYHQEAMCDEDMPALFQYFTKVSLLLSSTIPPSFSPLTPRFHVPLRHASVSRQEALCDEESGGLDLKDPNRPRFTLQELRDVLHERNELKAKVFLLQEELAYYKRCSLAKIFSSLSTVSSVDNYDAHLFTYLFINCSDETEDDTVTPSPSPSPELRSRSRSSAQPESGIKRLYVTILSFRYVQVLESHASGFLLLNYYHLSLVTPSQDVRTHFVLMCILHSVYTGLDPILLQAKCFWNEGRMWHKM